MSSPATVPRVNIHGTGVLLGDFGLLLRGPSGAGKSLLALELLDRRARMGGPGFLVADDRLDLELRAGEIVMHAPKSLAGLVELRGRGIVRRPSVDSARADLVVDLVDDLVRMLEEAEFETDLLGVTLARCPVPRRGVVDSAHQLLLIGEAVAALVPKRRLARQKTT